jgi:hypothetical protein
MIAVLTGDIVSSRSTPDKRMWLSRLREIMEKKMGSKTLKWGVFRGDGFQVEVPKPADALKVAILIRAGLRSSPELHKTRIDARIGIGIGEKGYSAKSVNESDGEAYQLSGSALDSFNVQYRLQIETPWPDIDKQMNVSLSLASAIIENWTLIEAETASLWLLENETQVEMAKKFKISQPAVHKRVNGAHLKAISNVLDYYAEVISTQVKSTAK